MRATVRRLVRLEDRYGADHPGRIADWLRPWYAARTIEELELLDTGLSLEETGAGLATLPPETRARYEALCEAYGRFCEGHRP